LTYPVSYTQEPFVSVTKNAGNEYIDTIINVGVGTIERTKVNIKGWNFNGSLSEDSTYKISYLVIGF